jgi:hypothetical protein
MNNADSTIAGMFMIPGQPALSVLILVTLLMIGLYMGRSSIHFVIVQMSRLIYSAMRLGARSLGLAEKKLRDRNREVLLELGREQVERQLDRDFFRVNTVVERDLGRYPALQRVIADQITAIEEDYKKSGQMLPPTPEWIEAVEAVAKLKLDHKNNPLTANILDSIHEASVKHQKQVMKDYRESVGRRHRLLQGLRPYWRRLTNTIDEVGDTMKGLMARAQDIDTQMDKYEEIRQGSEKAERTLRASAGIQFVVSLFVVLIAVGGAIINFNLIALPMSEMVGATARIGGYQVADISAMVIILVEISMGLFLMEALRFTRLFPVIGSMDDRLRLRMIWITFTILFSLACVESALAFMRDQIATDLSALRHSLSASGIAQTVEVTGVNNWIPMVGQMVMGFILPFALTFVAIPLESLANGCRSVFGDLLVLGLRAMAFMLRLVGNVSRNLGQWLTHVYDVFIFVPLWVEKMVLARLRQTGEKTDEPQITLTEYEVGVGQVTK